jgi:hypothetical protein
LCRDLIIKYHFPIPLVTQLRVKQSLACPS